LSEIVFAFVLQVLAGQYEGRNSHQTVCQLPV